MTSQVQRPGKAIDKGEEASSPEGQFVPSVETGLIEIAPVLLGKASGVRRLLSWTIGFLGFLALILVVLHFASPERIVELVRSANPAWLLPAVIVQLATYVCAALVWRQALRRAGHPRSLRTLVPLGIAKLFADQVLPSGGISGMMLTVRGLTRRRVPLGAAMATMVAGLVSYNVAYLVVVLTGAGILWLHDRVNLPLLIGVAIFVVVTVAIPAAVLGLKRWGDRRPIPWLGRLFHTTALLRALVEAPTDLLHSPGLLIQTAGLQLGIFILDALTFWLVFRCIGDAPETWVIFVSFAIASMTATIAPIPLGLGIFEAGSVGVLNFLGVSIEAALAGTLLLRGLTFWLPMLPGIWLARHEFGRL